MSVFYSFFSSFSCFSISGGYAECNLKKRGNEKMNSNKINARIIGVLYIVAAVAAIIGLILYDPILNDPDYLVAGAKNENQIILGALFELVLACSAIGTAIMLYPYLRKQNESIALGYVCFRFFEAVIIVIGIVSVLSLLTLSREFVSTAASSISTYQTSGTLLLAVHEWTFILGPNFMLGVNTLMYSYLFYRSKLVPKFISVMGLAGASMILIAALLEMFGVIQQVSAWGVILAIPIAFYEMILAVWLIVKGFNAKVL
jgi:hypothetical protein